MRFYEKIWYKPRFRVFSWLIWPLSIPYCFIAKRRKQKTQALAVKFPVPVVVIGNLTVGGTGKTPVLIALARQLMAQGIKVGVVSRGYKSLASKSATPIIASDDTDAQAIGDEPFLIYRELLCPVVVHPDRVAAVKALIGHFKVDVILSDDGLQHYALARDIEIVVVDGQRQFGNRLCLPAGPLREPVKRLRDVDFVLFNQGAQESRDVQSQGKQFHFSIVPEHLIKVDGTRAVVPLNFLQDLKCHAVAGIGNPERFFNTLRSLGALIIPHAFSDHHEFRLKDFGRFKDLPVIMTQKDAVKCEAFALENAYALEVGAQLPAEFLRAFLDKLGCIPFQAQDASF